MNRLLALGAVLVVAAAGSGAATAATRPASPAAVARAWSKALNANDNAAAAELFAHNARVVQPGVDGRAQDARASRSRSTRRCPAPAASSTITRARRPRVATFVLGERPKHHCDAPGHESRALFVVRNGKITLWQQVAVPKPDPGEPIA